MTLEFKPAGTLTGERRCTRGRRAAKQNLPGEADDPNVTEITISEANLVLNISGELPERELNRIADELKDAIEDINTVLEVELTGNREEVVEVIIDFRPWTASTSTLIACYKSSMVRHTGECGSARVPLAHS